MKRIATLALGMVLLLSCPPACGAEKSCFEMLSEDDLVCHSENCPGIFEAGDGVGFHLAPGLSKRNLMGPPVAWMSITVLDGDTVIRQLPESFYIGYAFFARDEVRFWMIGEYTGGSHCCSRYHFFARRAPGKPLRYVGTTQGSAEGIGEEPFSCRDGVLYLEDWDTRFLYFHTPYAQSLLLFPTHYRITPSTLQVDNIPFREKYLRLAGTLRAEMKGIVSSRTSRPASILNGKENGDFFSDELGQLLVKRAILHLYARDEKTAWNDLEKDTRRYYRQGKEWKTIRKQIRKILSESPY